MFRSGARSMCRAVERFLEDPLTYYLAENNTSKDFHDNICKKPEKLTATGVVSEKDGKKILTASKIVEAKEK